MTRDVILYQGLYLSLFEDLSGLPNPVRCFEDFLADFSFSKPLSKHKGLGPIACAALCGDPQLIRELAAAKASLETHAPGMPETMNQPDLAPLHLAVWFKGQDVDTLQTLLELRANPNLSTMHVFPPLCFCRSAKTVELLIQHRADANSPGKVTGSDCNV